MGSPVLSDAEYVELMDAVAAATSRRELAALRDEVGERLPHDRDRRAALERMVDAKERLLFDVGRQASV